MANLKKANSRRWQTRGIDCEKAVEFEVPADRLKTQNEEYFAVGIFPSCCRVAELEAHRWGEYCPPWQVVIKYCRWPPSPFFPPDHVGSPKVAGTSRKRGCLSSKAEPISSLVSSGFRTVHMHRVGHSSFGGQRSAWRLSPKPHTSLTVVLPTPMRINHATHEVYYSNLSRELFHSFSIFSIHHGHSAEPRTVSTSLCCCTLS
jgi:hypothetical protein